jgi:poly-gamma-glutamate synthesis protein (capsule biosynthesis protein)
VTWSSDNALIASVDENTGVVTGGSGGVAHITATSQANPSIKTSITVHVRGGSMRTVTITAAGDAVLGGDPRSQAGGAQNPHSDLEFASAILKQGDYGAAGDGTVFTRVASYFAGENNIATCNLECTLTNAKSYGDKSFVFRGKPEYAASMLKAHGIDAVCIANNHSYDVGSAGYSQTKSALKSAGVQGYGNGTVGNVTTGNGLKVGFLAFVAKDLSIGSMGAQIRSASKKFDMVVVAFHWTDTPEFRYAKPSTHQKSLAHAAINAGADLVVGHHTHRLNGIERYKGRFIVYDLGNFVTIARNKLNVFSSANPQGKYDYDSLIYQQKFNIWSDGFVEAAGITLVPCAITSAPVQQINTCQPMPYSDASDIQRVFDRIEAQSPSDFSEYPIRS